MKKFNKVTVLIILAFVLFLSGIIFNLTWLFLVGLAGMLIAFLIDFELISFKKKKKEEPEDNKVDEVTVEDGVLYFHHDNEKV